MRAEQRRWVAHHPDYERSYRAAHRARIAERTRAYRDATREQRRIVLAAWKKANPEKVRQQRQRHAARLHAKAHPDLVLQQAATIVGASTSTLIYLYDPLREDLLAEAALAMLEGRDPREAVRRYRSTENAWGRKTRVLDWDPPAA